MPVTISRPRAPRISSTAATKARPSPSRIAADSAAMPPASASSVRSADSIRRAAVVARLRFAQRLRFRHGGHMGLSPRL